ncbi:MAG: hypothetical protein JSR60_14300 [Proteobacteria bacterium]|nr:hypothetical protein [Pseudomonadota bacterium]
MLFIAKPNTPDVVLTPKVIGKDSVAFKAKVWFTIVGAPDKNIPPSADGTTNIPPGKDGDTTAVRVNVESTAMNPTAGDVYVTATQGGVKLPNFKPKNPADPDWLFTIPAGTANGAISVDQLFIAARSAPPHKVGSPS